MNPWDRIKKELEAKLSPESYQNWISRTAFLGLDGATLVVSVADEGARKWMETEYATEVMQAARQIDVHVQRIEYVRALAREPNDFEDAAGQPPKPQVHVR